MKAEKLSDIRKELQTRTHAELMEISLRLARHKLENKELLNYLLFHSDEPLAFAEDIKSFLLKDFESLPSNSYALSKSLRKILRLMGRYAKYTASKQVETELWIWYCQNFLDFVNLRTSNQSLRNLLLKPLEKITKLLPKLHEDLQFDYQAEFDKLINEATSRTSWVRRQMYL